MGREDESKAGGCLRVGAWGAGCAQAVMQVSERVGMRLNPHLPADVQTEVLRTLFQCFMGQHSEGVTPAELVEVLDALGHPTTLEEVTLRAQRLVFL